MCVFSVFSPRTPVTVLCSGSFKESGYLTVLADPARRGQMIHFTFRDYYWVSIYPGTINSTPGSTQAHRTFSLQSSSIFAEESHMLSGLTRVTCPLVAPKF